MTTVPTPVRLSPLHHKHIELRAEMSEGDGWIVADHYPQGSEKELSAAMTSVGMADISQFAKLDVKGTGTDSLLRSIFTAPPQVAVGEAALTPVLSDPSLKAAISPLYLCRLAGDQALLVASGSLPLGPNPMDVALGSKPIDRAYLTNVTSVFAGISLSGPKAFEILSRLTQVDVSPRPFPNGRCLASGVANALVTIVHADGKYDGQTVPSYDLFFGREYAEYMWDSILEAGGHEVGVFPIGLAAYNQLHANAARGTTDGTPGVAR